LPVVICGVKFALTLTEGERYDTFVDIKLNLTSHIHGAEIAA